MSQLIHLKTAYSIADLSRLLGSTEKKIKYLLYGKKPHNNYYTFEIPKRSGGTRLICAPNRDLKVLQQNLSRVLQDCIEEINVESGRKNIVSHGFRRDGSIFTNAKPHRNKRYVLNVDLKDFFPSINFGRVRGFFINNRNFELQESVATVIAQIVCFNNSIPQGSPSSPVISNLIGHILDHKLLSLATDVGCTYTRYADDLTFSTNKTKFPLDLANYIEGSSGKWVVSEKLAHIISMQGFMPNHEKTRMQYARSSQRVTGLVVNKKLNVSALYWRTTRSMCHRMFLDLNPFKYTQGLDANNKPAVISTELTRSSLNGRLNYIYEVERRNHEDVSASLSSKFELYRAFLFYHYFFNPERVTVLLEGETDSIYLKLAFAKIGGSFPKLVVKPPGATNTKCVLNYFKYNKKSTELLSLAGGTAQIASFISSYSEKSKKYRYFSKRNPVIVVIDNDTGSKAIFSLIKNFRKLKYCDGSDDFYYMGQNLYVVVIPKTNGSDSAIEDLFEKSVLDIKIAGKTFSKSNNYDIDKQYGKMIFATKVVAPNVDKIKFDGFTGLFSRIEAAIENWELVSKKK